MFLVPLSDHQVGILTIDLANSARPDCLVMHSCQYCELKFKTEAFFYPQDQKSLKTFKTELVCCRIEYTQFEVILRETRRSMQIFQL